jgi:hypothetical protein
MRYLDSLDNFTKGTFKGDNVFDVAEEDPGYIANLLDNFTIEAQDREMMSKAIGREIEE